MPLDYVPVRVVRLVRTRTAAAGKTTAEAELPGSPFLARVYRVSQSSVDRDEGQPAVATLDQMQRLSVLDPACEIRVGDIAFLPQPDGTTQRAKVLRPRRYGIRTQYDLETGADGDAPLPAPGQLPVLPPTPSAQAQIDALTAQLAAQQTQIGDLIMAASLPQPVQPDPVVVLTTTATLTRPSQSTVREIKPTANMTATLYPATGSGIVEKFDVSALGSFTFAVALASGDSYDANNAGVAAAIAQLITNGAASFSLRDVAPNTWHWE